MLQGRQWKRAYSYPEEYFKIKFMMTAVLEVVFEISVLFAAAHGMISSEIDKNTSQFGILGQRFTKPSVSAVVHPFS